MANKLKLNSVAPNFSLTDRRGKAVTLADIDSEYVVVYFYPRDDTPGCTIEAQEFSVLLPRFRRLKTAVIGISGGDDSSKEKFCRKYSLKVPLVSDTDFKVARAYGAYGEKTFMGRKSKGIIRRTFILNKERRVVNVFETVKALGHAQEVLQTVKNLA